MTGLDWPAITAICAACGIVGAIIQYIINKVTADSNVAELAKSAASSASVAIGKAEIIQVQLNSHQVETARTLGKFEALLGEYSKGQVATEQRFAKAIEDLVRQIEGMNTRTDRVLEVFAKGAREA